MRQPVRMFVPTIPGLENPPMVLEGPVVEELPDSASIGDLVTYEDKMWAWSGSKWIPLGESPRW